MSAAFLAVALLLAFFMWRFMRSRPACPQCGSRRVTPEDIPGVYHCHNAHMFYL